MNGRYPLEALLELRGRDQDLARQALLEAENLCAEALEALGRLGARLERAADAVHAHQQEVDGHLEGGFTVAESLKLAQEALALSDAQADTAAMVSAASVRVDRAREEVEAAREALAEATRQREVAERHKEDWLRAAREAALEAEDDEVEAFISHRSARDRLKEE